MLGVCVCLYRAVETLVRCCLMAEMDSSLSTRSRTVVRSGSRRAASRNCDQPSDITQSSLWATNTTSSEIASFQKSVRSHSLNINASASFTHSTRIHCAHTHCIHVSVSQKMKVLRYDWPTHFK